MSQKVSGCLESLGDGDVFIMKLLLVVPIGKNEYSVCAPVLTVSETNIQVVIARNKANYRFDVAPSGITFRFVPGFDLGIVKFIAPDVYAADALMVRRQLDMLTKKALLAYDFLLHQIQ